MKLRSHEAIKYKNCNDDVPPSIPKDGKGDGYFTRSFDDKLWLFHRRWEPPLSEMMIDTTVMIIHGTVDHSGQYHELATKLLQQERNIAVIAMDMRGWGYSDGESMYIDEMETFCRDVETLYRYIHSLPRYSNVKKRFLMGKSLGGTVTAFCITRNPNYWTNGYIGLSGAYQLDPAISHPSVLKWIALKTLAYLAPKLPIKKPFEERYIVSDPKVLQKQWREDEFCSKDKVKVGYIINLIEAVQTIPSLAFDIPMLMMCGDSDKVVMPCGHQLMLDINSHDDKQVKYYIGGYHNLLLEPNLKDTIMKDIVEWITKRS